MMAIVVRGATCSLGESVVDRLLSWDIDVIASEPSHAERNSSLLQFSPVSLKSEGTGFSISFDGSDADIIVGKEASSWHGRESIGDGPDARSSVWRLRTERVHAPLGQTVSRSHF